MLFSARGYVTSFLAALPGPLPAFAQWFLPHASSRRRRQRTVYRLSSRGLQVSDAVKEHNANMRFKTREAAARNRAHPLDMSAIVPFKVSRGEYHRLFKRRHSEVADLRQLPDIKATRLRVR